ETSQVAAAEGREHYGLSVYRTLREAQTEAPYDLAVAWHVLEHTTDPLAFLRQIRVLLQPDGIFALQVPAFESVDWFFGRDQGWMIVNKIHNFQFEKDTLAAVLATAGFQPVWLEHAANEGTLTAICRLDAALDGPKAAPSFLE